MPSLTGLLETALYVDDLDRASHFYEALFGLTRIEEGDRRFRAYSVAGRGVLLLFKRGASNCVTRLPFGTLGPHDGRGSLHMAFSIPAEDLAEWENILARHDIAVESRIQWPRGGTSLYFRDPDQNLLELATPGIWSIY
jgi:catechol 2,3-dioxygenase-like lactoylglutathione lyase family enzyme